MAVKEAFLGGLGGATGTVIVGAIFSSATLNVITGCRAASALPPGATILSTTANCGGGTWTKVEQASRGFFRRWHDPETANLGNGNYVYATGLIGKPPNIPKD
jgi:hypothetical protein